MSGELSLPYYPFATYEQDLNCEIPDLVLEVQEKDASAQERLLQSDIMIMMDDLNIKVSFGNIIFEHIMRRMLL